MTSYRQNINASQWHSKVARKRWTDSDLRFFAKMHVEGSTLTQIAQALGRTTKAIENQLSDTGLVAGYKPKTMTATKLKAYIQQLSTTKKVKDQAKTGTKPANHNTLWNPADEFTLVQSFASGQRPEFIAGILGRTIPSILGRLHALKVLSFDPLTKTYYTKPVPYYTVTAAD